MAKEDAWEYLLDLNGTVFFVDEALGYWVKFVVQRVPPTPAAPHGVAYSLTLHDRGGGRLMGFDNAHRVGRQETYDHWHRHGKDPGRGYRFESPERLLADFWREVDRILQETGHD